MPLTPEQIAEMLEALSPAIESKVGEAVVGAMGKPLNDALTKRFTQFEKGIEKTLDGSVSKALESLSAKQAPPTKDPNAAPDPKDPNTVALKTMESKLAEMLARAEAADQRAKAERSKNREATKRQTISDNLAKLGLTDPVGLKLAVTHQIAEGRIDYENDDDDNAPILYRDETNSMIDLGQGLKKWMATPEAKHFMPASGAKGSGSRPAGNNGTTPTKEQASELAWRAFGDALVNKV